MSKAVSANEAKNRLGSLLRSVSTGGDEVIVESHGKPKAVIISIETYEEMLQLREQKRRTDALAELRALRDEVRSRNASLGADEAEALADRVSREMVDDLAESGGVSFERDER